MLIALCYLTIQMRYQTSLRVTVINFNLLQNRWPVRGFEMSGRRKSEHHWMADDDQQMKGFFPAACYENWAIKLNYGMIFFSYSAIKRYDEKWREWIIKKDERNQSNENVSVRKIEGWFATPYLDLSLFWSIKNFLPLSI